MRQHYSATWNAWITPQEKIEYLQKTGKLVPCLEHGPLAMKCGFVAKSMDDLKEHLKTEPTSITAPYVNKDGKLECPFVFQNVHTNLKRTIQHAVGNQSEVDLEKEIGDHYLKVAKQCYTKAKDTMKKNAKLPWFKKDAPFAQKSAFEFASRDSVPASPEKATPATSDPNLPKTPTKASSVSAISASSIALPLSTPSSAASAYLTSLSSFLPSPPGQTFTFKSARSTTPSSSPSPTNTIPSPPSSPRQNTVVVFSHSDASPFTKKRSAPSSPEPMRLPPLTKIVMATAVQQPVVEAVPVPLSPSSKINIGNLVQQNVTPPSSPSPPPMSSLGSPKPAEIVDMNMLEQLKSVNAYQTTQLNYLAQNVEQLQREKRKLEYEKEALAKELLRLKKFKVRAERSPASSSSRSSSEVDSDS